MTDATYDNTVAGEKRFGNWMQTYSGGRFFPLDPRADEIRLTDIAASLSKLCRFNGHCKRFYSVAEHSILVSQVVPPQDAFAGLMHDAAEAYVGDVIRPLKRYLTGFDAIEDRVWRAIAERFNLPVELPTSVKWADNAVLLREAEDIMADPPELWNVEGEPADVAITGYGPEEAECLFRSRYIELTGESLW